MGDMSIQGLVKSARPVVPQIYAYTTPGVSYHDGWIKIGYTEQDVDERIYQQTHTAGVRAKLEWNGNALFKGGSRTFRDTDFHAYLARLGIEREKGTEWFRVSPDASKGHFYDFCENKGVIGTPEPQAYTLRAEQERAVAAAVDYAHSHENGEFLWNCKPRFGKTIAAYELVRRLGARTVLVVTNRPAIACSWYDDYEKFVGTQGGYWFVSEVRALRDSPSCLSRAGYLEALDSGGVKGCIEFVSLQDLKGSVHFGGGFDKLSEVKDLTWDVLIVDEAHEGVDTYKTDVAFDQIDRRFTLHLSGTPFKAIASEKFASDAIFNWTYADEQQACRDWDDEQGTNPYEVLPRLNLFTYQMSEIALDKAQRGVEIDGKDTAYAFDLNEFFSTRTRSNGSVAFEHNAEVDNFLDALATQEKFPFSTPELRDELRHTLWLLNRVDSARALAKKLQKHPVFGEYVIVLAAGDGRIDDTDEAVSSFEKVRAAISDNDRTITLSVGQLTTGVTMPEWSAVLMLSNVKSPALYMQAAFRAQNPCLIERDGGFLRKENAYVFDFDPARTLDIYEQFANDLCAETATGGGDLDMRRDHVRTLLNFFPVIGEDEDGFMTELDVERVLSIPRRIRSREVVHRGFMCDFLFQNITNVFRAPGKVLDIIGEFDSYKAPKGDEKLGINPDTADKLSLNEDGDVELSEELVIGTATEIFGDTVYASIAEQSDDAIEEAVIEIDAPDEEDERLELLKAKFTGELPERIIAKVEEHYTDDLKPALCKRIERSIKADVESRFAREVSGYKIERAELEMQRDEALEKADSRAAEDEVNHRFDEQLESARLDLATRLEASRGELVENAAQTAVCEVETAKRETKKHDIEARVRDHLRGFTRTIPSFLMAYGTDETTLAGFDAIIPPEVFHEVTGITVEEFRLLRDGGDVTNSKTGEVEHFDGHLFDPVVFDDAVCEFIRLRGELANYLDEDQEGDIFDYVPPQKTNQIFTPRRVVEHMVDLLERENPGCFDDPGHTFADLYMKSGLYITEIIKRLYASDGMCRAFPDDRERLDHIIEHQVYGIAPTEIIFQIATHYILGYDNEVGGDCEHNFIMADSAAMAKEGTLAAFVEARFGRAIDSTGA